MKVIVIGAGIIGLLTACRLKQQGVDVVVVEKSQRGRESSWAGAGILCPIHPWLYPHDFSLLVNASLTRYPEFEQELLAASGVDIQRIKSGLMIPCFADDIIQHQAQAQAWSAQFGWHMDVLNADQALAAEPTLSPHVAQALVWPEVDQVRNPELLKAVDVWLAKLGVEVVENAEVVSLLETQGGDVAGVSLKDGSKMSADAVLLAAGSWSEQLATQSGFTLPVKPVKGQIVLLKGEPGVMKHIIKHDSAYFVPRRDGRILVGASMENVAFTAGNTVSAVHGLLSATLKLVPGLKDAVIEHQWMGFRPGSPDGLPFMGPVADKKGLWVATGHYRNGVALAPITAELMASWMLGQPPALNMTAFSPDRKMQSSEILGYPKV